MGKVDFICAENGQLIWMPAMEESILTIVWSIIGGNSVLQISMFQSNAGQVSVKVD